MRWIIAFGSFWYDFIVGDSAVLAIGAVVILITGWLLVHGGNHMIAEVLLPLAVSATLVASLWEPRRRAQ